MTAERRYRTLRPAASDFWFVNEAGVQPLDPESLATATGIESQVPLGGQPMALVMYVSNTGLPDGMAGPFVVHPTTAASLIAAMRLAARSGGWEAALLAAVDQEVAADASEPPMRAATFHPPDCDCTCTPKGHG